FPDGPLNAMTPFELLLLMVLSETATLIGPPLVPSALIPAPLLFWNDDLEIETVTGRFGAELILTPAAPPVTMVSSILTVMMLARAPWLKGATKIPWLGMPRIAHFSMFTCLAFWIKMPDTGLPAPADPSMVSPRRVTTSLGPAAITITAPFGPPNCTNPQQ